MPKLPYVLSITARKHIHDILRKTREAWGIEQAEKYYGLLKKGFFYIAENKNALRSLHRDELAVGTKYRLHLVAHHYVVFEIVDDCVVISALFHESMDVHVHLLELQRTQKNQPKKLH